MRYNNFRIDNYTVLLFPFSMAIFYLMYFVRDTIQDRQNYIEHFANPVATLKIEIGFKYYMKLYNILGIDPQIAICLTSVLIYILLARVWHKYVKLDYLESILIFNFIMLSLFNHYVGDSIRMGFAIAVSLYSTMKILEGNKKYWIILFLSVFFHYGIVLYLILFTWINIFKNRSIKLHIFFIVAITICSMVVFHWAIPIVEFLNMEERYSHYFDGTSMTHRLLPFTILFLIGSLFLVLIKKNKEYQIIYLLVLYSIPFLLTTVILKVSLLPKMLMPLIFLAGMLTVNIYRLEYTRLSFLVRFGFLVIANIVAIMYALKMYQYY